MLQEHPTVQKLLDRATDWYVAVVLASILLLLLSACNFNIPKEITVKHETTEPEEPVDPQDPTKPPVKVLTFKGINNGVIGQYCLSCHAGPSGSGGVDLSSYSKVMQYVVAGKPDESKICQVVKDKSMPRGKDMDDSLRLDVCKWITQGAKES